jgi:hypothetical protein
MRRSYRFSTAFFRITAKRPTWYQGQPAYTEEGYSPNANTHCTRCRRPLTAFYSDQGLALRFCSNACRVAVRRNVEKRSQADYHAAMRAAGELKRLKRLTTCPNCKVEFLPKKPQWPPDPISRATAQTAAASSTTL